MKSEGNQAASRENKDETPESKTKKVENDNQLLRSKLDSLERELSQQETNTSSTISE